MQCSDQSNCVCKAWKNFSRMKHDFSFLSHSHTEHSEAVRCHVRQGCRVQRCWTIQKTLVERILAWWNVKNVNRSTDCVRGYREIFLYCDCVRLKICNICIFFIIIIQQSANSSLFLLHHIAKDTALQEKYNNIQQLKRKRERLKFDNFPMYNHFADCEALPKRQTTLNFHWWEEQWRRHFDSIQQRHLLREFSIPMLNLAILLFPKVRFRAELLLSLVWSFYFIFSLLFSIPLALSHTQAPTLIWYSYRVQVVLRYRHCTQQVDVQRIILTHYASSPTDGCETIAERSRWCWSLKCLSHSPSVLVRVWDERSQRLKSPVWCRKWVN